MTLGPLSNQMGQHILLMSVLAPLFVAALQQRIRLPDLSAWLVPLTVVQMALLWFWHAPSLEHGQSPLLHALMLASLSSAALLFWWAVFTARSRRWRALLALLTTSKLFCLLGVLMAFAPRALYTGGHGGHLVADQHLAGLMMLVACPATYLVAAVIIAARWLRDLDHPEAKAA